MDNKYFKIAGDLTDNQPIKESLNSSFKPAGDLNDTPKSIPNNEQEIFIKNYLLEIVSGEELYDNFGDLKIVGSGSMILSFNEIQKMVEEGCYNFIKAEYFNPEMIEIKYKKIIKENNITK